MDIPTFKTVVNTHELSKHFKEYRAPGDDSPYYQYVSKSFYGAIIRSQISLVSLDLQGVVVSVRLKGRHSRQQTVTGVKIDLMEMDDPRIQEYNIQPEKLETVVINVQSNIPGNIVLHPEASLASAYFYKYKEGSSLITFDLQGG